MKGFQPFGYHFDIIVPMARDECRQLLHSAMADWFHVKPKPRGWIVGPWLCLWYDPFNAAGPMLFGRIANNGNRTRISGLAGSDLNFMLWMTFLLLSLLVVGFMKITMGAAIDTYEWAIGGAIALVTISLLWLSHRFRHDADPLVRFVERTLNKPDQSNQEHCS